MEDLIQILSTQSNLAEDPPVFYMLEDRQCLGLMPRFLSVSDNRPATVQFNERYAYGGGWRPMKDWKLSWCNYGDPLIKYRDDPKLFPIAVCEFLNDDIYVYPHDFVMIRSHATGNVEVSRIC